jgi:hypothetical protein
MVVFETQSEIAEVDGQEMTIAQHNAANHFNNGECSSSLFLCLSYTFFPNWKQVVQTQSIFFIIY